MIVGLIGFIGSGKGTVGEILSNRGYAKESFAQGVKDITSVMFGWERSLLEGDTELSREFRETPDLYWSKKFGRDFTPREALQKMGTEVGRNTFHEDFWVMQLEHRIESNKNYVITDVRFPNEIDWIHKTGGVVYEVSRGPKPYWYKTLKACETQEFRKFMMIGNDVHYSEWAWVGCENDGEIMNDGTLEDLTKQINDVILSSEYIYGDLNETV